MSFFGKTIRTAVGAVALTGMAISFSGTASAGLLDNLSPRDWNLNLSVAGSGAADITNVNTFNLEGASVIQQDVVDYLPGPGEVWGPSDGTGPFPASDFLLTEGYARFSAFDIAGGGTGTTMFNSKQIYLHFAGLTGQMGPQGPEYHMGTAQAGTVTMYLVDGFADIDGAPAFPGATLPSPTTGQWLADLTLVDQADNTQDDAALKYTSSLAFEITNSLAGLFTDSLGNALDNDFFFAVATPSNTTVDDWTPDAGEDYRTIITSTQGGFGIQGLPEPASLALLGMGLLGMGAVRRRKTA